MASFLKGQLCGTITYPISSPAHTIIITGANTGLGYSAAEQFLAHNSVSRLILACRSLEKANVAKTSLLASTKNSTNPNPIEILTWQLDMSSKSSILAFSERCKSLSQLDAIILNAGVDTLTYELSEGYETTIMVNVIGTMMLAVLMVPILRQVGVATARDAKSRITIVGSAVQFMTDYQILLDTPSDILKYLSGEDQWKRNSGEARYMLSKGILQMMVQQLAATMSEPAKNDGRRTARNYGAKVIVNCVAPGFCRTELFRENQGMGMRMQLKVMGRDADVGARALIVGALGAGEESHGKYMSEGIVKKHSAWFDTEQGMDIGRKIWREVCAEVESVKADAVQLL